MMAWHSVKHLLAAAAVASQLSSASVLQPTPPMGFNNWASVQCGLNETLFVDAAHLMAKNGLLAAGYNRINLDDCWSTMERAANGSMMWNPDKFPRGLPWLTNHLKSLGFIPGIYTDAGNLSCGSFPGALGHEELDAKTFAGWGFEYLKLDGCNVLDGTEAEYKDIYGHWHEILSNMDPPIVFSESAPAYFAEESNLTDWYTVMDWVPTYGQLARHSRDVVVFNSTNYNPNITGWDSIMFNYGQEVRLARYQKPGYYNDPDFLNVDHPDLTMDEKKSHFAIWSSLSAPLILSTWIPGLTDEEIQYLTNKDIIAVDQDPLTLQATLVSQDGTWDVLTKDLSNGDRLVTIINLGGKAASHTVSFERLGLGSSPSADVKDLWTGKTSSATKQITAANIPPHGTAILRLSPEGNSGSTPTGMIFNTFSLTTLSQSSHGLKWANATSDDGQVWQTRDDSSIRPLSDTSKCLTESSQDGEVRISLCNKGLIGQQWSYGLSGNVQGQSGKCLTESKGEKVTSARCLYEDNTQVFGLPSGVEVIQPTVR